MRNLEVPVSTYYVVFQGDGGGGGNPNPVFKSRGWSNGGKKSKPPQKSLGLPTKPPKISGPKINPQKTHAEFFQALKISRKQTEVWL